MSRSIQHFREFSDANEVFDAMHAWREKCFFDNGSMFGEHILWTANNIKKLQNALDNRAFRDEGLPFMEELKRQLKPTSPEVIQLAAEAFWVCLLLPKMKSSRKKIERIQTIWEWSDVGFRDSRYIRNQVLSGIAYRGKSNPKHLQEIESLLLLNNPLSGSKISRRFYLQRYLLETAERIKKLPGSDKRKLKEDAWEFAGWLDREVYKHGPAKQRRHVTLYLLFPDHFERCFHTQHKKDIVNSFRNRLPEDAQPRDEEPLTLDRALYRIRQSLEEEYAGEPLDFYYPPLSDQWPDKSPSKLEPLDPPPIRPTPPDLPVRLNTILYGPPGTGKTYATARYCIEICDGQAPASDGETRDRYAELVEEERIEFITFHQSYGYEEFVEGLRPDTGQVGPDGQTFPGFRLVAQDGVLKRIASRARQSADSVPYVLVIDEINRANVSKVLGELVTLLEEDKRAGADNEVSVQLPHSGERFTLPANLYILGTMNTADRSIALLDTALRRRFEFVELAPDSDKLTSAAKATGIDLPGVLEAMNEHLEWLIDRDHQIGHAWLMSAKTREDVDRIMRHKIIPLIAEYFYDDWRKVQAVLGGTDDFVKRKQLNSPPGLEDEMAEERYRWTINKDFSADAYVKLLSAKPSAEETPEA